MSNVLVTGANGQLGSELKKLQKLFGQNYIFTDVAELDITDPETLRTFLASRPVSFIINCAAYTDVDGAESQPDTARLLNRDAVGNLKYCLDNFPEMRLIHMSTDYVFKGDRPRPLKEDDPAEPESVYGTTKLEGEQLLHGHPRAMVIRTSWMYSTFGKNFVRSILRRMEGGDEMRVVYDQVGTPTCAEDLANAIMQIISDVESGQVPFTPGVFHYSNEGVCSWYDLAVEICRLTGYRGRILPIETVDYPLPAKRPAYSVLSKSKIRGTYRVEIPYWRDSLEKCIHHLL